MGEPRHTHTPGPWHASTAGMIEDAEGHWIGDATTHVPNYRANALLMAAAPDLLEALTAARAAIASLPEDTLGHAGVSLGDFLNPELDQQWPVRDELLNNIDVALLKASHGGTKDVCECGDYRHQHQAGVGSCCFNAATGGPGHHGAPDCDHFRLSQKAARSPSHTEGDGNG